MTHPSPPPVVPTVVPWYVRPRIVLPLIAAMVIGTALLTPDPADGRAGDRRLSTHSTKAFGAGLLYELAERLGWRVERRETVEVPAGASVIHAVLAPPSALSRNEVGDLMQRVRGGAALFVVLGGRTRALEDSLHVAYDSSGYHLPPTNAGAENCAKPEWFTALWPDNRVRLFQIRFRGGPPPDSVVYFLPLDSVGRGRVSDRPHWGAAGFPVGRGRVVVGADPDIVRNDALRVCGYDLDVPTIRMLEYLRDGGDTLRTTIIFDEYHHGFGAQPGTLRAAAAYLGRTPSGHLFAQLAGAALILLLAVAPRTIAPRDPERIERRSPLEHVDALARAYAQVGATRTATGRLVRGLRRRVEHGTARGRSALTDEAFLERALHLVPAVGADIALIRRGLAMQLPRKAFADVGAALHRIESSLIRI